MTDQRIRTLTWIGLLAVGLMTGILLTLWLGPEGSAFERPQSVERVQLGTVPPSGYVTVPQSEVPTEYLDALSLNEVFKDVSARVTPAVVFIQVLSDGPQGLLQRLGGGGEGRRGPTQSAGSGVIISDEGYVVTNFHVVEDASEIWVTLQDKRQFPARVVGTDPTTDLAVLEISGENLPVIALGDANAVSVGEWVLAVGNPFRLTSTVTAGIVSALGRQVNVINDQLGIESFIQTDAAINPGNSGGAVVNLRGELVGIATAIATETGSYEGYGFAVPVDLMERVVRDLILYGEVRRGYLGVTILPVTAAEARQFGLPTVQGVWLQNVQRGLAGAEAGLRDNDILLRIEGKEVYEPNELQSMIALYSPGDRIEVVVWRAGKEETFDVVLKGRDDPAYDSWLTGMDQRRQQQQQRRSIPPPNSEIQEFNAWGVGLASLDVRIREQFGVAHGVFVAFVTNGGAFEAAGLSRGMIITHIDDTQIFNVETAAAALDAAAQRRDDDPDAEPALVQVRREDGAILFFEVEL
jgi:Do/DeqQ family serine protease